MMHLTSRRMKWLVHVLGLLCMCYGPCDSFVVLPVKPSTTSRRAPADRTLTVPCQASDMKRTTTTTALPALVNVPDGFFTITFTGMGLTLAIAKKFARVRMEENAWEQRLAEARKERLRNDPTLTELDLRRQEAATEWSAYGKPRKEEEAARKRMQEQQQRRRKADYNDDEEEEEFRRGRRRTRVKVMDREEEEEEELEASDRHRMSDKEIDDFEIEFGIEYDPYYDDPYELDELPMEGDFKEDKLYGDRYYANGETFFKDRESGLYYRQGAKPRNLNFWS